MAVDKLVDSGKLDACCAAEAAAIIAKGGGTAPLAYDFTNNKGFADAIEAIPSGGSEDPMSGSFTLPAPITKVAGLFYDTTLPETFTLNLPATCTHIGAFSTAGYSLFGATLGMKHLQINCNSTIYDTTAIYSNSVIEDVTFNDGNAEVILSVGSSSWFGSCQNLKTINAILSCTGIASGNNNFYRSPNIENIRFKPNVIETLNMGRWSASHLTNASIISLCNALKQGQSATASFDATIKPKLSAIYGTVAQDGGGIFTETGVPSDITLADFVTNTKGWTIA